MSSPFIKLLFPLTTHTGKIRVKKRKDIFYQGLPIATRQTPLDSDCYLEWQISYDLRKDNSNFEKHYSSVKNKGEILNEKKEPTSRYVYELSDYLIEIVKQKFIGLEDVKKLLKEVKEEKEFLTDELEIYRSHPKPYKFKQWNFLKCTITYPLLIYEVSNLLVKVEIVVKEKQKAVGIQPMLYLCLPLKLMEEFSQLEDQTVNSKQKTSYLVDKNNFHFIIETIRIFGILSKKHHQDVINILATVLWTWEERKEINNKTQQIKNIVVKIDINKIIGYLQKYPKSKTLRQIIKCNNRIQENQEEKQVLKLAVKIAYYLDKICDSDKTDYVKKDEEKKYWLKISRELFDSTLGPKETK